MAEMQKAIIYKGPGEFAYEDRPIPEIEDPDDVKVKSYGCCICGTDVNIFATPQKHPCEPGIIFGHEFCGEVAEVGSNVKNLKPGDKVIIDPHGPCGECDNCLAGLPEACENVSSRGVFSDGGLTNYLTIPKKFVYKVGPDTDPALMGMAEPLAGCGCALEKLNVHVGDTAAVLGAGPIGLMFTALLAASGCRKIIVSEPIEYRRKLALEVGATRVVNPDEEDIKEVVKEETDGLGVDHAVEAVAAMLVDCVYLVHPHGKVLQYGDDRLAHPEFPVAYLLANEIEVYGGYLGKYYMRKVGQIIESGVLPLDKILTHVIPASRYQEALDLAASRQCGKVFVSMDL
ncbi:MAG: alcohol dehydrogenase catalytic domain-containing protein [Eubacteriales bacterium]|jgi:threonine dehydrogenase-like Zn-dependent dehydrogenase|nr:alcohol dehydrogenase catalytic domain-containing protein [Eubacteriales bacterium]